MIIYECIIISFVNADYHYFRILSVLFLFFEPRSVHRCTHYHLWWWCKIMWS